MALSDITRKQARSDVLLRIDEVGSTGLIDDEINLWLDRGQFDFFNRMSALVEKWYGTNETMSPTISPSAGAVTQVSMAGNYAASKIAKIVKFIQADGTTIWHPVEFGKLEYMLGNSNYDEHYAYAWFGENLHLFVGTSATAISSNASVLHFIRKPTPMGGDSNVFTVTFSVAAQNDTVTVDGIVMTAKDVATTELADFITTGTNSADATNLNDLIGAIFGGTSGVTVSVNSNQVTITGAKTVVSSNANRLAVAATISSMLDVPTEYVDLPIMYAQARALGKLNSFGEKSAVENELSIRYGAIRQLYGDEIQIKALEKQAGIQTPRGE